MDRMVMVFIAGLKLVACYLIAGATQLVYMLWPNFGGHPHIPFTSFPGVLILSPLVPVWTLLDVLRLGLDPKLFKALAVFGVAFVILSVAMLLGARLLQKGS